MKPVLITQAKDGSGVFAGYIGLIRESGAYSLDDIRFLGTDIVTAKENIGALLADAAVTGDGTTTAA